MSAGPHRPPSAVFYLPATQGERFCIFHPPAGAPRGGVLYLHPFAEEMNKSRRMAALQSRLFAAHGYAVLQIDLYGCGDSGGDARDARWETWREDAVLGARWLRERTGGGVTLWGLRLGALLALDAAPGCEVTPERFILWQPVVAGDAFITQFLRLRVANEMMAAGSAQTGTQALRGLLAAGEVLEIAGYDLAPELVRAIDGLKLAALAPRGVPVHWFEVAAEAGRAFSPAARRVADGWIAEGVALETHVVAGDPFWNTLEIAECPALLAPTLRAVTGESA